MEHKYLLMNITDTQMEFLDREAGKLGISISNFIRRSLGIDDVKQGQRRDLDDPKTEIKLRVRK